MKNSLITSIIFLYLGFNLHAQYEYYGPYNYNYAWNINFTDESGSNYNYLNFSNPEYKTPVENKKKTQERVDLKLIETKTTSKNSKGKTISEGYQKFNSKGLIIDYKTKLSSHQLNYKDDTLLMDHNQSYKGKKSNTLFLYEKQSFIVRKTNHKGVLTKESITTYNEKGKETSVIRKFGKKQKNFYEYKSFYNEEGKLIKSQNFHKNKLKQEWTYDCSDEGKIIKNDDVQQNSVCKWKEEKNDGSYINYARNIYEKRTYLTKSEYNKDSILISYQSFLNDTIPNYSFEKIGNTEIVKFYNSKGKLKHFNTTILNEAKKIVVYESVKTGLFKHFTLKKNEYDANNLLIASTSTTGKKAKYSYKYTYDSKGKISTYKKYKKGKLISISEHINIYK